MNLFHSIRPEELALNPFQAIGSDWMLIVAANGAGAANPMTASWGGLGVLWGRPVAYVFIRPQRFTRQLIDAGNGFSLNFLEEAWRPQMGVCGAKSGRNVDKMQECGFVQQTKRDIPYIAQAHTALLCSKLYRQPLEGSLFADGRINTEHYQNNDHHILYIAEIEEVLVKDSE